METGKGDTRLSKRARAAMLRIPIVRRVLVETDGTVVATLREFYCEPNEYDEHGNIYFKAGVEVILRSDGVCLIFGANDHPYYEGDGYFCFGNILENIEAALRQDDWPTALNLITAFLQEYWSPYPDDYDEDDQREDR